MIVEQYNEKGVLLNTFSSSKEAEQKTGVVATNIIKVARGRRKRAGGFIWKYGTSFPKEEHSDTTIQQDLERGELKIDTYYDTPPTPDEIISEHKIDTKEWKLGTFYSKAKAKGWLVTAVFHKINHADRINLDVEAIKDVISKISLPKYVPPPRKSDCDNILRIVITDVHVGMEINEDGIELFGGEWNERELFHRLDIVFKNALETYDLHGGFDRIDVVDLGDFMDGLDGMTVRRTHELPQNMSNEKAFDVALKFKLTLLDRIVQFMPLRTELHFFNVNNDNHSSAFSYFVNSAFKEAVSRAYAGQPIFVHNLRKFIEHYEYGNNLFMLCHGKDDKYLKHGFKPEIDEKTKSKIEEYMKHYGLYGKGYRAFFEKGDSHRQLFDHCCSEEFLYHNYAAFSPASGYVVNNFKKGRSGFTLMVLSKDGKQMSLAPHYFDWKT